MNSFLNDIDHLSDALSDLVEFYQGHTGREKLSAWHNRTQNHQQVIFSGMGTSGQVHISIRARLALAGFDIRSIELDEWLHYGKSLPIEQHPLVLISQSGESVEIRKIIERVNLTSDFTAIVNDELSFLSKSASLCLPLKAGVEASISSKTYVNTLGLLNMMASVMESPQCLEETFSELYQVASKIRYPDKLLVKKAIKFLGGIKYYAFVGRGPSYICAQQLALTLAEGAHIIGSPYTGGAFRHGPIEAVGPSLGVICFISEGKTRNIMEKLVNDCAEYGARVVCVTNADIKPKENLFIIPLENLDLKNSEYLFPILAAPFHMLLVNYLAEQQGLEAGNFIVGGKITREE